MSSGAPTGILPVTCLRHSPVVSEEPYNSHRRVPSNRGGYSCFSNKYEKDRNNAPSSLLLKLVILVAKPPVVKLSSQEYLRGSGVSEFISNEVHIRTRECHYIQSRICPDRQRHTSVQPNCFSGCCVQNSQTSEETQRGKHETSHDSASDLVLP